MYQPETPFPGETALPSDYGEALRGLVNRDMLKSQKWQEQQLRADREGAHPDILEFERCFIRAMAKLGIPMFASEVNRSWLRQDELFALGHSRAKGGQSAHNKGCAVDLVHSVRGWDLDRKSWDLIGHIGKETAKGRGLHIVSLAWGGDWGFYDPAHWEVKDWRMVAKQFPWPDYSDHRAYRASLRKSSSP